MNCGPEGVFFDSCREGTQMGDSHHCWVLSLTDEEVVLVLFLEESDQRWNLVLKDQTEAVVARLRIEGFDIHLPLSHALQEVLAKLA